MIKQMKCFITTKTHSVSYGESQEDPERITSLTFDVLENELTVQSFHA